MRVVGALTLTLNPNPNPNLHVFGLTNPNPNPNLHVFGLAPFLLFVRDPVHDREQLLHLKERGLGLRVRA